VSARGHFLNDSRAVHRGRHCATCTQFYESHGVVHPIRNSPGYDPEIEKMGAERREHARQATMYGREHKDRSARVRRPRWAAGISDRNLEKIAEAHGQRASSDLWWERAGLHGNVKAGPAGSGQRAEKMTGELRYELEAGQHRGDSRRSAQRTVTRRELAELGKRTAKQRGADRVIAARSAAGAGSDLPW